MRDMREGKEVYFRFFLLKDRKRLEKAGKILLINRKSARQKERCTSTTISFFLCARSKHSIGLEQLAFFFFFFFLVSELLALKKPQFHTTFDDAKKSELWPVVPTVIFFQQFCVFGLIQSHPLRI